MSKENDTRLRSPNSGSVPEFLRFLSILEEWKLGTDTELWRMSDTGDEKITIGWGQGLSGALITLVGLSIIPGAFRDEASINLFWASLFVVVGMRYFVLSARQDGQDLVIKNMFATRRVPIRSIDSVGRTRFLRTPFVTTTTRESVRGDVGEDPLRIGRRSALTKAWLESMVESASDAPRE